MHRWLRILRHRWFDEGHAQRALGDAAVHRLRERVAASERTHSGEIRLCVEAGLPLADLWRGVSPRERALALFGQLRVWDTENNNGVLIYLLLAERRVEIVADRGLSRRVDAAQWQTIAHGMGSAFRESRFEDGLKAAVDAVSASLRQHFPLGDGEANPNELPDALVLR